MTGSAIQSIADDRASGFATHDVFLDEVARARGASAASSRWRAAWWR